MRKFNLFAPEFDHSSERDGYRWRAARVGRAIGGHKMGASLYELEEGQRSFPFHFHHGIEEWLLVLAGSPVLRTPNGERTLERGDLVCFPVGPGGGHQVSGPGTLLVVSASCSPESIEYPESGKVAVRPPGKLFRTADAVGFWDGE